MKYGTTRLALNVLYMARRKHFLKKRELFEV